MATAPLIRLFGQARFESGATSHAFRAPAKAIEALAYLATHHDAPVSRNFLAELLWPDDEPEDGRAKLRRHLHVLVQALPQAPDDAPYLVATKQTVRWNRGAAVVDTIAFREAGAAGRFTEAIEWYGGDFLEAHHEDWAFTERERLRSLQLEYLRASLQQRRSARDLAGALADATRILAIDPFREDVLRTQMRLRVELGDRSGALCAFRSFTERLRAEMDVDPAPETRAIYDAIAREELPADDDVAAAPTHALPAPAALPFVGRQAEFDALSRAWAAAARGRGSLGLVYGEAGSGKSRLAAELALRVEQQGGNVLLGATTPGEARPYEAVVDALRGSLSLVVATLPPADLAILARVLPEIGARTSVVEPPAVGAEAERQRLFEVIYRAIAALARKRPLLIVLEDLHWTTASTAALIEYIVRRVAVLPVLLVGTFRDEDVGRTHPLRGMRRRLESEGLAERIALGRFDVGTVGEIARLLFPARTDIDALAHELYAYSEGVALFLDEAVHERDRAPAGVRLNVPARIERLGESARTLLEIAAVAGSGFNVDVLGEVAGWNEADVLRALDDLVEARFVREGRRRRFGDYAFSHHLVHAAVYAAIPPEQRRRRHALVGRVLSALSADSPDSAGEIALHYDLAGDGAGAAVAYAAAARHARALYANEEALAHAERSVALSADVATLVEMHVMRGRLGNLLGRQGTRGEALAALAALDIPAQLAPEVEGLRTISAMFEGRFDVAQEAARRFVAAAESLGAPGTIAQAHAESATIAIVGDRWREAEEHLRIAESVAPANDDQVRLRIMRARTFLAQRRGAHDAELNAAALRLLEEARRAGDPQAEAEAEVRLAHVEIAAHRFADARAHFAAAAEAYRRFGSPRGVDSVENNCANLALWTAGYENASVLYGRCLAFAEDNGDEANQFSCAIGLSLAQTYLGNPARGLELAESVAHLFRDSGRLEEANWHLARALAQGELGDGEAARAAYDASLAIHRGKPATALFAITLAWAAHAALDAGDAARAQALDGELGELPGELLRAEEFPHLMLWARSRVAALRGDDAGAAELRETSERLYEARAAALDEGRAAYAAVPWNARFLAEGVTRPMVRSAPAPRRPERASAPGSRR